MSDTPLTDRAVELARDLYQPLYPHLIQHPVDAEFAKSLERRLAAAWAVLEDTEAFGRQHTGYGYTCSKKAQAALEGQNETHRTDH